MSTRPGNFFQPGHFAKGDHAPDYQSDAPHPVLVDLLTPDFNDRSTVEKMWNTLAASLAEHAAVPLRKIFINHRPAHSGTVFDDGQVVFW